MPDVIDVAVRLSAHVVSDALLFLPPDDARHITGIQLVVDAGLPLKA